MTMENMMDHKYGVVVPTLGIIEEFSFNFENLIQTIQDDTHVVLVINAHESVDIDKTKKISRLIFDKESTMIGYNNVTLSIIDYQTPIGYAKACNEGYRFLKKQKLNDYIFFVNDDVTFFSNGWMNELADAINSEYYHIPDFKFENEQNIVYRKDEYGLKTGMSSVICNNSSGANMVGNYFFKRNHKMKLSEMSNFSKKLSPYPSHCIRTAGVVVCLSKELCLEVEENEGIYDEKTFKVGGYEDDDLSVRIREKGFTSCVSLKTIVAHQGSRSLNKFESQFKGFSNAVDFFKKYENMTQRDKIIGGLYRVKLNTVQDVLYFKSSINRTSQLTDKLCLVLTDSLFMILQSFDFPSMSKALSYQETELFRLSSDSENYEDSIKSWVSSFSEYKKEDINLHIWKNDMQEKDERNKVIDLARQSNCDWGFSVDHDEVIEERITKDYIQKLTKNPNPLLEGYLVTWTNHWESSNVVRKDFPIDDGGSFKCGMAGIRIFKISERNIVGGGMHGLHCGPSPTMSALSYTHANISMRHFGMLRSIDREIKRSHYDSIDRQVNQSLVGGSDYSHINKNEMIQVSQYEGRTGVGLTMLCYDKECWQYIAIWMMRVFSVVDEFILTWTSEWEEEDKEWMYVPISKWKNSDQWYETGPCYELAYLCRIFKIDMTHCVMSKELGFSYVRNHGIDILRERTKDNKYLRWGMFFDPDEMCPDEVEFARSITAISKDIHRHGFLVKYNNPIVRKHSDENDRKFALSESTRFFRLDMPMRMNGRVHESFNDFFANISNQGINPRLLYFPIKMFNMSTPTVKGMNIKLKKYVDLLCEQLDNEPLDSGSWVSLGLQAYNDGDIEKAVICYERGVLCAGHKYLAFEQMALHHLRIAKDFILYAIQRLPKSHDKVESLSSILKVIESQVPKVKISETDKINFELPDFPYDKIKNDFGILITDKEKDVPPTDRSS
ncbi:MAG: glycosyltransferase family 2 protein [Vampirovibrionia bacterium]